MAGNPSFFAELKRRNVFRAAVLYAGAVWALSQGISQLSPALGLPDGATRWFLIAAAVAYPFWIAFAWFYEFTPQGFKREHEVAPGESIAHATGRKLDFAIIAVLAVAVVLLASGYFVRRAAPTPKQAAFDPPAGTIVVLPFTNQNDDPKQRYFSDGITEDLTGTLGQSTGLKVIAWDTASRYRNSKEPATAIARQLDVASVLTGRILREGNEVRVIVELVNAVNGYQLWASHFDDSIANIFQVQDQISGAIAAALKVKFAAASAPRSVNPQAYDLVLKARALMNHTRSAAAYQQARALLEEAVALDPDYANAHAWLARVWIDLPQLSTLPRQQALPKARTEANRALAIDPDNVDAIIALAIVDANDGKLADARAGYQRAIELDPSNVDAHIDYAAMLRPPQALAEALEAVRLDPGNTIAQYNLAYDYYRLGEYAQSLPHVKALLRLDPHSADNAVTLALIDALLHRNAEAARAFDLAQPDTPLAKAIIVAGKLTYESVLDPAQRAKALAAVEALRRRSDLDPVALADVIQMDLVLGKKGTALNLLAGLCTSQPGNCSTLGADPLYVPLRGDPRFEALARKYDTVSKPAAASSAAAAASSATAH